MTPVKIVAAVMLVSLMLNAGVQCDRAHLVAVLKNYGLIGRALLANVVIVPILGVLAVRLFAVPNEVATGLLLMAIAPGVPFAVFSAGRKKGGSLGFAIALAFILPLVSIVTIPLTDNLVLPTGGLGRVPTANFLTTLVLFQLIPILAGIAIANWFPAVADKIARPSGLLFVITVVILLILLAPDIAKSIASVYGSRGMLAELFVIVLSVAAGWLLGGPELEHRRTLGLVTALRNIGLCALIAAANFPGTLVTAAVMTYLIVQIIVTAIVGSFMKRRAKPMTTATT